MRLVPLVLLIVTLLAACATVGTTTPGTAAEAKDMRLVGHEPLQARSAYQPLVVKQGDRWIAYVGHHGGERMNALTGRMELNGTSIVDVTDPAKPQYLHHIPGAAGEAEAGGASMVRICDGRDLPKGDRAKTYLLRTLGRLAHEVWDVTDPRHPGARDHGRPRARRDAQELVGVRDGHRVPRLRRPPAGLAHEPDDEDLRPRGPGESAFHPRLRPRRPGAGLESDIDGAAGVHGPIVLRNRVYFAYGTGANGVLQIVDRDRLLNGNPASADRFAPTPENLRYPEIGRLDMPPDWGGHTSFPVLGVPVGDHVLNLSGRVRDVVVLVSESLRNECQEIRQLTFLVDITVPSKPFTVSTFEVPERPGDFCRRGGRFGPHSSHESFTSIYYRKLVFLAYFNAGVRAVDIRNPFAPRDVAHFIPAVTAATARRCVKVDGNDRCKVAIQTNNVEVDDRGLIYLADRADTGLHIVELTGAAKALVE